MNNIKKELASIIKGAKLFRGIYVARYVNEQGNECVVRFKKEAMETILERVKEIDKKRQDKYNTYKYTQKCLAALDSNRTAIQYLFDIQYIMKRDKVDAQEACRTLFKLSSKLPDGFIRRYEGYGCVKYSTFYLQSGKEEFNVSTLVSLLPILPKAWLKGIEIFEP